MGNKCVCISSTAEEEELVRDPKCVSTFCSDIKNGLRSIPSVGGDHWTYKSTPIGIEDFNEMNQALRGIKTLKRLDLIRRGLNDDCIIILGETLRASPIEVLSISHNFITDKGFEQFCSLITENSSLTSLTCDGNQLTTASLSYLGDCLQSNQTLKKIDICLSPSMTNTDSDVQKFGSSLEANATVDTLSITGENGKSRIASSHVMSPTGMRTLFSKLTNNTTLRSLQLSYLCGDSEASPAKLQAVGPAIAQCSAFLLQSASITHLDLTGNNIGDEAAESLAGVLNQSSLTSLSLARNCLVNALPSIGRSLGKPCRIKKLDLSHPFKNSVGSKSGVGTASTDSIASFVKALEELGCDQVVLESLNISGISLSQNAPSQLSSLLKSIPSITDLRHSEMAMSDRVSIGTLLQSNTDRLTTKPLLSSANGPAPELKWKEDADAQSPSDTKPDDNGFIDIEFSNDDCYG